MWFFFFFFCGIFRISCEFLDLFFSVLSFFPEILELTTEILVLDFLLDLNVIWAIPSFFFFL